MLMALEQHKKFALVLAAIAFIFLTWTTVGRASNIIHYRITVTMETPEGEVSGSTVRGVELPRWGNLIDFPEAAPKIGSLGEAVIIDLGKKGKVFALIKDSSWMELLNTFPFDFSKGMYRERIAFYNNLPRNQPQPLRSLNDWPKMVWFEDINDPKSVKLVYQTVGDRNPWAKDDRSAALFGEGYAVKGITIEITDDPVTYGQVEKYLPKFDKDFWEWQQQFRYIDYRRFGTENFRQGER
jgi:hypothetical protein